MNRTTKPLGAAFVFHCLLGATISSAVASDVQVVYIDDHAASGQWIGSKDGRAVELRQGDDIVTIPLDDIALILFPKNHLRSDRQRRNHSNSVSVEPVETKEHVRHAKKDETGIATAAPTVFYLADGGRLYGHLIDPAAATPSPDKASGDAAWGRTILGDTTLLPFDRLAGIQLADAKEFSAAYRMFRAALTHRLPGRDLLITRRADGVKTLRGRLETIGTQQGSFAFGGQTRTFRTERIFGVVFAGGTNDAARRTTYVSPRKGKHAARSWRHYPLRATLADGSIFSGSLTQGNAESVRMTTSLGATAALRLTDIDSLCVFSNRVVYLSDLEPTAVDVEGWLHRPWPVRWDQSVSNTPLAIDGHRFEKGIGVHSKTTLSFQLDGRYEKFVATLGIDDAVRPRGSVLFRILADGKVLFESEELTGTDAPRHVLLDVAHVTSLTLIVDFGHALDVGDQADWGAARLLKPAEQTN